MESVFQEALAHQVAGRLEEAEALYRQIVSWRPSWVLGNLGVILRITGRLEEGAAVLREAHAADPHNLQIRHTLGMTLLQLGRYAEGWRHYEARFQLHGRATREFQEWQGESLRGRRILILGEQGFGDQILLARFLPLLAEQAAEVMLVVNSAIAPLFAQLPVRMVPGSRWETEPADVWASMGSVARWLEAGPADAPAVYLAAPARPGLQDRPGLMLEGGAGNPNMNRIPPPPVARAIRGLAPFVDLDPAASGAADFAQTAELVAGLERVVSVDTSVAHLAGAMGRPCWVLLPRPAKDWFTNWGDDRSPWYPSMRTLRQRTPGDWAGVIGDVAASLQEPASEAD